MERKSLFETFEDYKDEIELEEPEAHQNQQEGLENTLFSTAPSREGLMSFLQRFSENIESPNNRDNQQQSLLLEHFLQNRIGSFRQRTSRRLRCTEYNRKITLL